MSTEKIFSYGTLQYEDVQKSLFHRVLHGQQDTLIGYKVSEVIITDPKVLELSGEAVHKILFHTEDSQDKILGTVYEITSDELLSADVYESQNYKRIQVQLLSGTIAWLYVSNI